MTELFKFTRRSVAGKPCECCRVRGQVDKVFVHRADHPDGESGAFTAFTHPDLKAFVEEAAVFLGWEVKAAWTSRKVLDKFPKWE